MLLIKSLLYLTVLVSYYFLGKKLNLISTTESYFKPNLKAVFGAGILFPIIIIVETFQIESYNFFTLSVFCLALLSFLDDLKPIKAIFKLTIHLIFSFIATVFILKFNFKDSFIITFSVLIIIAFYTNANNFMDGINGMMVTNNILILSTLLVINSCFVRFTVNDLLIYLLVGALFFSIFNFRKKAFIISGDVGSIVLGFTIIIFVFMVYFQTSNIFVFGLIIIFFVETFSTLFSRAYSNKRVLESHKEHLYEVLVINYKTPVIKVTFIYAFVQLLISTIVLASFYFDLSTKFFYAVLSLYTITYLLLKYKFLKHAKSD